MSSQSIPSLDKVFFGPELQVFEDCSRIEELAQKTQSIWSQVYGIAVNNLVKMVHIVRTAVGSIVRDAFFFPLKCPLIANHQVVRNQLQIEENYYHDFWDPTRPLDPSLNLHAEIREKFTPPENRVFSILLKDGRTVKITCSIIQTKEGGDHFYNFAQVPGNYTTISNNIGVTHPYLAAYLNSQKEAKSLPPARFIVISENNLNFKPAMLDEAGFVLLETLKILRAEFGSIDQLVAHSLGNIFLANALKQVDDPRLLPKHICLDRGPTSIWEASKKYFFGLGRLIYLLAKCGKWASDIEQDVVEFCQKWKERPSLLITGVIQDHHFSGSANLCLGEKIKKIDNINILTFNPPRQLVHQQAHHNLRPNFFNSCYLTTNSDFMNPLENLPEAIIRHSLAKTKVQPLQS